MGPTAQRSARVKGPIVKDGVSYNFRIRCYRCPKSDCNGAASERKATGCERFAKRDDA
jgi:hypothetical protein